MKRNGSQQFSLLRSFHRRDDVLLYTVHSKGCEQRTLAGKWRPAVFLRSLPPAHPRARGTAHMLFATSKSSRSLLSEVSAMFHAFCTDGNTRFLINQKKKKKQVISGAVPWESPANG